MKTENPLIDELLQAGIAIGHHATDLYIPDTKVSRAILANHGKYVDGWNVQRFISHDSMPWLDVPFNYY